VPDPRGRTERSYRSLQQQFFTCWLATAIAVLTAAGFGQWWGWLLAVGAVGLDLWVTPKYLEARRAIRKSRE
jgi:hypothetical protein